jgi:hypothetical protein
VQRNQSQTPVLIPTSLVEAIDSAVAHGAARSRDRFLATAVLNQLARCDQTGTTSREDEIDAAFELMASDPDYQREASQIAKDFAASDWEAFKIAEGET